LPSRLQEALKDGYEAGLTINKAVLNPNNTKEYVLVYDSGPVYYSFHKDFVEPFKAVIDEWSAGMERCGRYPVHEVVYPFEGLHDNDHDSGIDIAHNNAISDDFGGNQTYRQNIRDGKRPENRQISSGPQQQLPKGTHSRIPNDVTRASSKMIPDPPSQDRNGQGNRAHGKWRTLGDEVISFFRVP